MAINNTKQSNLERKGYEERNVELVRSDYKKKVNEYSDAHIDALSNPEDETKVLGKGVVNSSHQAYVPDASLPSTLYNYSSLKTTAGGGAYDIHGRNGEGGRNRLLKINIYSKDNAYGPNSVDTSANIDEGQYVVKM